ncbi:hypothetical protein EVAR_97764_1 [Eumeta japonica]|uniref:Uncharacterized protein n=1 Tax=Eumeta variegata TaxID=151549 RepID=A0A4C1Y8T0_EUMVA|nr:hypothetical protein EVAR_97764_1 [Eumeta japonica]
MLNSGMIRPDIKKKQKPIATIANAVGTGSRVHCTSCDISPQILENSFHDGASLNLNVKRFAIAMNVYTALCLLAVPEPARSAAPPPPCLSLGAHARLPDDMTASVNVCEPTKDRRRNFVTYQFHKDPRNFASEWTFNGTAACTLCLPSCYGSDASFDRAECTEHLSYFGFRKLFDAWYRITDRYAAKKTENQTLTYVIRCRYTGIPKRLTFLADPLNVLCSFVIENYTYDFRICKITTVRVLCPDGKRYDGTKCV